MKASSLAMMRLAFLASLFTTRVSVATAAYRVDLIVPVLT